MDGSGDDKPPAPPVRQHGASQRVADMQTNKPLPSVPEEKKKKKLKYIFTGDSDKCEFINWLVLKLLL